MNSTNHTWKVLKLTLPSGMVDDALALLSDFELNGIEEQQLNDGQICLKAYFDKDKWPRIDIPFCKPEVDWIEWNPRDESWRQHFSPFEIVPGMIIQPSWESYQGVELKHVITMDPGMAFGTGLHPTTRMCAQAIHEYSKINADTSSLLDVGCGSGILCLIAHSLRWRHVMGVEIDDEAALIARQNMAVNSANGIQIYRNIEEVKGSFQMVVANILLNTLLKLRKNLVNLTSRGGRLVLSGITSDQVDQIVNEFSPQLTLVQKKEEEEWCCLVFERQNQGQSPKIFLENLDEQTLGS